MIDYQCTCFSTLIFYIVKWLAIVFIRSKTKCNAVINVFPLTISSNLFVSSFCNATQWSRTINLVSFFLLRISTTMFFMIVNHSFRLIPLIRVSCTERLSTRKYSRRWTRLEVLPFECFKQVGSYWVTTEIDMMVCRLFQYILFESCRRDK